VDLHREVLAAAERPADAGEVNTHALRREPEAGSHLVAVDVEPLRRDVDVHATLAVRHREPRLGAEERLVLAAELVDAADGDVAGRIGIAVADHDVADDVRAGVVAVAMAHRRPVGVQRLHVERPLGIVDDRQRLVLDADRLGGPARLLGMVGRDERDRLADVADTIDREHRLVGELEAVGLLAGNIGVREDGMDAGHRDRAAHVQGDDPRVRVRAAERVAPQHPGCAQVAGVRELARRLRDAVGAEDSVADAAELERAPRAPLQHSVAKSHSRRS
jgi:hypothetical protein